MDGRESVQGTMHSSATNAAHIYFFNVLLPVHFSVTLVNNQRDAQLLYFIIRFLHFSTCFEQRRAQHQELKLY